MWDPEGYRMVPLPHMVADFRDNNDKECDTGGYEGSDATKRKYIKEGIYLRRLNGP